MSLVPTGASRVRPPNLSLSRANLPTALGYLAAVLMVVFAVLLTTPTAADAQRGEEPSSLTIRPNGPGPTDTYTAGDVVLVAADGCPDSDAPNGTYRVDVTVEFEAPDRDPIRYHSSTLDSRPPSTHVGFFTTFVNWYSGDYTVEAKCIRGNLPSVDYFDYEPVSFTLTGGRELDPPTILASPSFLDSGDAVDVAASPCTAPGDAEARVDFVVSGANDAVGPFSAPAVDGRASTNIVIPSTFPTGFYDITATCWAVADGVDTLIRDDYPPFPISVIQPPPAEPTLTADPTSLLSGETLTATASPCASDEEGELYVEFGLSGTGGSFGPVTVTPVNDVATAELTVPASWPTGLYNLTAECFLSDAFGPTRLVSYPSQRIIVDQGRPTVALDVTQNGAPVDSVEQGSTIDIRGTECPNASAPLASYRVSTTVSYEDPSQFSETFDLTPIAPPDGPHDGSLTLPDSAPTGRYTVEGTCFFRTGLGETIYFEYEPTDITVTAPPAPSFECASDAGVLTWTDAGVNKYWVYRSADGINYQWIGRTTGATTFEDVNPFVGAKYRVHYQGIPQVDCTITAEPPSGSGPFECEADGGVLTWTDAGVNKYWVYRSADGVNYQWIGRTTGATTFEDRNTFVGAKYQVHYQGIPKTDCAVVDEPPSGEVFECAYDRRSGILTWSDADVNKYWVYRSIDGGDTYKWLGRTTGATTFEDFNQVVGARYQVHYQGIPRSDCELTDAANCWTAIGDDQAMPADSLVAYMERFSAPPWRDFGDSGDDQLFGHTFFLDIPTGNSIVTGELSIIATWAGGNDTLSVGGIGRTGEAGGGESLADAGFTRGELSATTYDLAAVPRPDGTVSVLGTMTSIAALDVLVQDDSTVHRAAVRYCVADA